MRLFWAFLASFPLLAADVAIAPQSLTFAFQWRSSLLPAEQGIVLTSPEPFAFSVTRPVSDNWLVLPSQTNLHTGTGPIYVPVNINPGALGPGTYTSSLTVKLPQGSVAIPVTFLVSAVPVLATDRGILGFNPSALFLTLLGGLSNGGNAIIGVRTETPWLTIAGGGPNYFVSADPVRAGPGLSAGSVQVTALSFPPPANSPLNVPAVYMGSGFASRAPLTATPSAVAFTGSGSQQVAVAGGAFTAASDAAWVKATVSGQTLTLAADATGLTAGSYQATVVLNSAGVLQALPLCLTLGSPALAKVANAASYAEGGIAPGEVVVLGGSNLGPCVLAGLALDPNGFVSPTLAGVQVTFDGVAAPLLYVSATQVAAVAPYDLEGRVSVPVQVTVSGRQSNVLTVPVAAAAPGIFTANASGTGPAASFRTGDVVSIFLTGEGQTTPAGINGKVTTTPPVPRLPVEATIDGQPAEVLFAGEAPGVVSGVMQVNLRAASGVRSGPVPVAVTVGGTPAQAGVTVSIR